MDVGLSGSLSGSIGGGSLAGGSLGGPAATSKGSGKQGVNVLGGEGEADPMAQTHITPPKDQINLEGVGSGSGLLDLTVKPMTPASALPFSMRSLPAASAFRPPPAPPPSAAAAPPPA